MKARHTYPIVKINRREQLIAGSGSGQLPGAINCRERLIARSGQLPGAAKLWEQLTCMSDKSFGGAKVRSG